jgi:hypothetical protein
MAGTLDVLPDQLTPGESVSVTVSHAHYTPAAGYTLAYRFAAPTPITVAGTDNGAGGWTLALTSAQTLLFAAGELAFDALVTLGTATTAIDRGMIDVLPSPLTVSQWRAVLTSIDAAIAEQAANGQQSGSISVDGMSKSYTYRSLADLMTLRAFCLRMVARESGRNRPYRILSGFNL